MQVNMMVNGEFVIVEVEFWMLLVYFFCDQLWFIGIYWGCDISNCGICVVEVDGVLVKFCMMFVVMVFGYSICMVEGLVGFDGQFDLVQEGFMCCYGL